MAFIDCPKKVLLSQTSVVSFLRMVIAWPTNNGLIKIDDLYYSTARLIGNPLSMRLDDNHLRDTILSIESTNAL